MSKPIRVVQYGLGPIGIESARAILTKQATGRIELVGVIDTDPVKRGKDPSELLGFSSPTGLIVSPDAGALIADVRPDVVLHATTSFLRDTGEQIRLCVEAGVHVISSTEELFFPFDRHPEVAAELNRIAEANGVVILGTGVNPGFAMDTLALSVTGMCTEVKSIHVRRVVDAAKRRLPLQRKIGASLTIDEFEERQKSGTFGHIGLRESLLFLADGLEWEIEQIVETLEPVVATKDTETMHLSVKSGQVAGIHHMVTGHLGNRPVLSLDLQMYVDAEDPLDAVRVVGTPPIDLVIHGGIFGDTATVAALVNAIPLVLEAKPGLRTMKNLPVPRAFATSFVPHF